jgi:hypothetical protein
VAPLAALPVLLLLAVPALAGADPFGEFRIPDHSWTSGSLSAGSSGSWSTDGRDAGETRRSSLTTDLHPRLYRNHDGETLQHSISVALGATTYMTDEHESSPYAPQWYDGHYQATSESWALDGSLRAYPWSLPVGLGIGGTLRGDYQQNWRRIGRVYVEDGAAVNERRDDHHYAHRLDVTASAGLGRVRDATVVQVVHVLEERLRETGAITRELSPAAREQLARLYYASPGFAAAHERPDRYEWREIERILRNDGTLAGGGLDAYSLVRARERPLYLGTRLTGWFAGPVVDVVHRHETRRQDWRQDITYFDDLGETISYDTYSAGNRATSSQDDVNLGAQVEIHRPLGWRWQLDAKSRITAPVSPDDDGLDLASSVTAGWMLADRWELLANLSQQRNWLRAVDHEVPATSNWATGCGLQLGWFVEDHLQISASVTSQQGRESYSYPYLPATASFSRSTGFSLGLGYRFLGRFDAPGLVEPVRPASW